ncbi:MAG: A/G-specific adenine glycosylase [Elusimicrobia bacterium GWA2_69_24]|nr:MAG: A/G-specific adenine glycosylase [Elusimicrobia bacterium GWA2_69_24]HBL15452.1 A/G-specific adenine glycosylase [Elusimicrobiota bacterium]
MRRSLLRWYRRNRRRLPWRERPSPYRTWISEVMLQQTQVATVLPYFERFLRRFPDLPALARAREAEVLRLWAGLGYYSRARNLLAAARRIASEHAGRIPEDLAALRSLPGFGRYTAAAIASIAFRKPHELVDGNVARVLCRAFAVFGDPSRKPASERVWELARELLARRAPGDWNQALMELGALVCRPDAPLCGDCPWRAHCRAFARGLQDELPESGRRSATLPVAVEALLLRRGDKVLLWRRSDQERLLPRHWSLPETRHVPAGTAGPELCRLRHSITRHRITLTLRAGSLPPGPIPAAARWVPAERLPDYLVSSLWRKAVDRAAVLPIG